MMAKKQFTIFQAAKDLITGKLEFASPETVKDRMDICNGCEVQNSIGMCTACGCLLVAKTRLAESTCPMELW